MKELEDNLLFKLVNTKGSLVDDESLIQVLRTTKVTAIDVNEKIRIADETSVKISGAREEYRPIAIRGSILYFMIVELSMVNPMYQTSLDQFLAVFTKSLNESAQSPVPNKRIHNVIEFLTYETYCYTMRGLYTRDKFLLTILLALKCDIRKGKVLKSEFDAFIKGGGSLDLKAVEPKPKTWILDLTWLNVVQLSALPVRSYCDTMAPSPCHIPCHLLSLCCPTDASLSFSRSRSLANRGVCYIHESCRRFRSCRARLPETTRRGRRGLTRPSRKNARSPTATTSAPSSRSFC
jgi:hypothetical protein